MTAKSLLFRTAGLLSGALLLCAQAAAAEADALPEFNENFIKYSAGGMQTNGSKPAAQARTQISKVGAAGIEAFNLTRELSKETTLVIDGQAMPGAEDYLAQFRLTKAEVGTFEAGFKSFRTFYDGAGGFFPGNNVWMQITPRAQYVDRAKFFVNATVALPKAPVWTVRFTDEKRDGRKDSTILGDTSFTGIPNYSLSSMNPTSIARKILPAMLSIDERLQTLEASVRHTFGQTKASLTLVGTRMNNINSRNVDRFYGELRPYPAIPSTPVSIIAPAQSNNPNSGYDIQGVEEDSWAIIAKAETPINDKISLYAGASFRTSDGDITGSRLINLSMASTRGTISGIGGFTSGGRPPYSYTSTGNVTSDVYTANVGVNLKPSRDLAVSAGLKAEDSDVTAHNLATYVSTYMNQATGTVATPQLDVSPNHGKYVEKLWAPELDARYTGIKNLTLYGSADYRTSPGDERISDTHVGPGPSGSTIVVAAVGAKEQKVKEKHLNAKIGANWIATRYLTVRAELFSKDHENRFDGYGVSAGGLYVLDYDIYGARATAVVKASPTLSFTTRYVVQKGQTATTTDAAVRGDSGDSSRHTIAETINWNPTKQVFVQADVSVAYDTLSTSYPEAGGTANDVNHNADNNYWNGSLLAGFAVDKETNLHVQTTYYRADNFNPALTAATVPYGASAKEMSVTFGLTRKVAEGWLATGKIGYIDSKNDTWGGYKDFRGPVAFVTVQHGF